MIEIDIHKTLHSGSGPMKMDLKIELPRGCFATLFGKSGVGKTSVLRMLSGLMKPESGRIAIDGTTWYDSSNSTNLSPQQREVGLLFQDFALFPNMTVEGNLRFALSKGQDAGIVKELIELMELEGLRTRKPDTLSGGQKQRVALARALVNKPKLLLLDEPFSAVDQSLKYKLQSYILRVHAEYGLTTLLVTHDRLEILKMSDQVIEIIDGQIGRMGPPKEVLVSQKLSGKFQFTAEVAEVVQQDFLYLISLLIGNETVEIVADENDAAHLKPGDKVIVASKAWNPVVRKIG